MSPPTTISFPKISEIIKNGTIKNHFTSSRKDIMPSPATIRPKIVDTKSEKPIEKMAETAKPKIPMLPVNIFIF